MSKLVLTYKKHHRFFWKALILFLLFFYFLTLVSNSSVARIGRWWKDDGDINRYFEIGSWATTEGAPYLDVVSEYPQIPTYFFGFLRDVLPSFSAFITGYYWVVLVTYLGLLWIFWSFLDKYECSIYWSLFLVSPSFLYFGFQRFDIFVILSVLLSLWLFLEYDSVFGAGFWLGVGFMVKWVPALILPVYFLYWWQQRSESKWQWFKRKLLPALGGFSIPVLFLMGVTFFQGGLRALWTPYAEQLRSSGFWEMYKFKLEAGPGLLSMGMNPESLFFLLNYILRFFSLTKKVIFEKIYWLFLLLQLSGLGLAYYYRKKIRKKFDVVLWTGIVIGAFIFFNKIYSPQWLLWVMPLFVLALAKRGQKGVKELIIYDLTNYMEYTIGFPLMIATATISASPFLYYLPVAFFVLVRLAAFFVILRKIFNYALS